MKANKRIRDLKRRSKRRLFIYHEGIRIGVTSEQNNKVIILQEPKWQ